VNWPESCAIVIPCFNEARHIRQVVQSARRHLPHVFVIDDGSHDLTCGEARIAGAQTLRHSQNQGKGAALASGLTAALERGFTWALIMDGDGQHASNDIPKFLRCAEKSGPTLVVGNRMSAPTEMPLLRRMVNRWMSRRISRRAGCRLPDTQCGFRLINLGVWRGLELRAQHFEVESELLFEFVQAGQPIEFVPIEVIYKTEQSKIRPWVDTLRWFQWWHRVSKGRRHSSAVAFDESFAGLQENSRTAVD
jgi:glycosyltransferase involved in cell wall biosynthesis